jgi:hypothetical protein
MLMTGAATASVSGFAVSESLEVGLGRADLVAVAKNRKHQSFAVCSYGPAGACARRPQRTLLPRISYGRDGGAVGTALDPHE